MKQSEVIKLIDRRRPATGLLFALIAALALYLSVGAQANELTTRAYGQNAYGQNAYGQNAYGQNGYGGYGQNGYWPSALADRIVVRKMDRELLVLRQGQVLHRFRVSLGRRPYGAKLYEGDGRTPEGTYFIDGRNPESRFYKSLHISYPSARDIQASAFHGVPAGGEIVIHGLAPELADLGPRHVGLDWTEGCIAVTNEEMDILWSVVTDGTVIEILP